MILRIDILDYQDTPPSVAARFWWSDERGVTCDNAWLLAELNASGIVVAIPSDGDPGVVYPRDGRAFFDALPLRFTGLERAQNPVEDPDQGGA